MSVLRDGTEAQDARLDRLVHYDPRSLNYPIRGLLSFAQVRQPRSYTWSIDTVLDQGDEGACVGFGCTHELLARPRVVHKDAAFAREQVYWQAQQNDPWPGGAYPGATPQYEGTALIFGAQVLKDLGYLREYRWAFGLDDLVLAVGYKGPAVLGVPWYEGMLDIDSRGLINVRGEEVGGHAILCNAVNVPGRTFTLTNSWGPDWGIGGRCRVSWDDMEKLLHANGEACIPLVRGLPGRIAQRFLAGFLAGREPRRA